MCEKAWNTLEIKCLMLSDQKNFLVPAISCFSPTCSLMLSKSDTRGSAMSGIAGFMSCSFMKLIYQKFSCISVLSQAELGMQLKTQLNWDQNCIFTEWNELDVRSAMFGMAEFWVSDFESISILMQTMHANLQFLVLFGELHLRSCT